MSYCRYLRACLNRHYGTLIFLLRWFSVAVITLNFKEIVSVGFIVLVAVVVQYINKQTFSPHLRSDVWR